MRKPSQAENRAISRRSYVRLPDFIRGEEIEPPRRACLDGPGGAPMAIADGAGNAQEGVPCIELNDDLVGVIPRLERVAWHLEPGEAIYFHCNLPHASGPNISEAPRTIAQRS